MRIGLLWVVAAWLFVAGPMLAQTTPAPEKKDLDPEPVVDLGFPEPEPDQYQFWVRAEYLGYFVRSATVPVSVVTGNPANPTQQLFNSNQSFGMFSGLRITLGAWLDVDDGIGWDANFFGLLQRTQSFGASSSASGSPTLALPFASQIPGAVGDTALYIAMPGVFAGNVQIASTLQLWGAETNGIFALVREGNFEWVALAGFRYVDLRETLSINTVSNDILTSPVTMLSQSDQFNTRNQFYGAQLGTRVNWQNGLFGIDAAAKVALGATHQTLDVQGSSTQTGPGGPNGTFPGGFFAQTSNSGNHTANQFGVIPSLELKFSVFITPYARAFIGYDFLYWNDVVRPGNQIDHNINLTQSAVLGGGALMGSAYPAALFNRTDFWAQGFNVGFELRF